MNKNVFKKQIKPMSVTAKARWRDKFLSFLIACIKKTGTDLKSKSFVFISGNNKEELPKQKSKQKEKNNKNKDKNQ